MGNNRITSNGKILHSVYFPQIVIRLKSNGPLNIEVLWRLRIFYDVK
jgi:hypothetical protein